MALVLAIGIVVDDAIVMGENISRRMGKGENRLVCSLQRFKTGSISNYRNNCCFSISVFTVSFHQRFNR